MSYYDKAEQETVYNYDALSDNWRIYSTYPPHIRKIEEYAEITSKEVDEEGRTITIEGYANRNQIRLFKPRK